jgi:hypothetical protein
LTIGLTAMSFSLTMAVPALASRATPFRQTMGAPVQIASTVPANGDLNPYGIAIVTSSTGRLVHGSTLISNFNAKSNVQGTGVTIVQVSPARKLSVFATVTAASTSRRCPGGVGLTTALGILPGGWVVVGSLHSGPGGSLLKTFPTGCLIVLDHNGRAAAVWSGPKLNGPWDMAMTATPTSARLYVADAMPRPGTNGGCEVVRLDLRLHAAAVPTLASNTVIGSGYECRSDKTNFVLGPAGIAIGAHGTAYVAETLENHVNAIPSATTRSSALVNARTVLVKGGALNNPVGLITAPNGDLIAVNGADGFAVETSPAGTQVAKLMLVKNGSGALFGLTLEPDAKSLQFVNDATNALDVAIGH